MTHQKRFRVEIKIEIACSRLNIVCDTSAETKSTMSIRAVGTDIAIWLLICRIMVFLLIVFHSMLIACQTWVQDQANYDPNLYQPMIHRRTTSLLMYWYMYCMARNLTSLLMWRRFDRQTDPKLVSIMIYHLYLINLHLIVLALDGISFNQRTSIVEKNIYKYL